MSTRSIDLCIISPVSENHPKVRLVTIPGVDANLCCGTHVKNTSQLQVKYTYFGTVHHVALWNTSLWSNHHHYYHHHHDKDHHNCGARWLSYCTQKVRRESTGCTSLSALGWFLIKRIETFIRPCQPHRKSSLGDFPPWQPCREGARHDEAFEQRARGTSWPGWEDAEGAEGGEDWWWSTAQRNLVEKRRSWHSPNIFPILFLENLYFINILWRWPRRTQAICWRSWRFLKLPRSKPISPSSALCTSEMVDGVVDMYVLDNDSMIVIVYN